MVRDKNGFVIHATVSECLKSAFEKIPYDIFIKVILKVVSAEDLFEPYHLGIWSGDNKSYAELDQYLKDSLDKYIVESVSTRYWYDYHKETADIKTLTIFTVRVI